MHMDLFVTGFTARQQESVLWCRDIGVFEYSRIRIAGFLSCRQNFRLEPEE